MKAIKKILSLLIAASVLFALVPAVSAAGEAVTLSLDKSSVYAGDSLTVTVSVAGSEVYGFQFNLEFSTELLSPDSDGTGLSDGWVITSSNTSQGDIGIITYVGYSSTLQPITENTAVVSVTFDISDDFTVGEKTDVSAAEVILSVGMPTSALPIEGDSVSITSVRKPSSDSTLSSLTLADRTGEELEYAPGFRSTRTEYSLSVPFEVTRLEVSAAASDENASVSINSPNLTVGRTAYVTVRVTAENGATRTYTVSVTRQEDPNREKGTDATLSSLSVEGYVLSPPFSPEVTEYIVWLPYETFEVVVSANTADVKAAGFRVEGNTALSAGKDNKITVTVTAEDTTVKKLYTVTAKRASAQAEVTTQPPETDTETDVLTEPAGNTSVSDGHGAEVIIPEGAVPEGAEVTITRADSEDELSAAENLLGVTPLCLYRVYIAGSNVSTQPDKPLSIQLPLPNGASDAFTVVLIPSSGSKNEHIPFTSKGGLISFSSAEAGLFAIIPASPSTTAEPEQTAEPEKTEPVGAVSTDAPADLTFTGMIKRFYLPLIIAIAAALILGFLIGLLIFKGKRKDGKPAQEPDDTDDEPLFGSDGLERTIVLPDLPELKSKDKEHIKIVGDISVDDNKNKH